MTFELKEVLDETADYRVIQVREGNALGLHPCSEMGSCPEVSAHGGGREALGLKMSGKPFKKRPGNAGSGLNKRVLRLEVLLQHVPLRSRRGQVSPTHPEGTPIM